jgi:protein-L-isoaspartate(D-aspartate) O-methyltransferase
LASQLALEGIRDARVLSAMASVPRHRFVPAALADNAWEDRALPIGFGQTISQPFVVAFMVQALELAPGARILEIGTGSGYETAVLACIAAEVYTVEIVPELLGQSRSLLEELGFRNVRFRLGDGFLGWAEAAPFDGIIGSAAPRRVPGPLPAQLKPGGRLVMPVGPREDQAVAVLRHGAERDEVERTLPVRFVPMRGLAELETGEA